MGDLFKEAYSYWKFGQRLASLHFSIPNAEFAQEPKIVKAFSGLCYVTLVFVTFDILFYSRKFATREDLFKLLVNVSMDTIFIAVLGFLSSSWLEREKLKALVELSHQFHRTDEPLLERTYVEHFSQALGRFKRYYILDLGIMVSCVAVFFVIGCSVDLFLEGSEYPLPLFYQVSFLPVTGWTSYIFNLAVYFLFMSASFIASLAYHGSFLLHSQLIIAKMDVTREIIESETIRSEMGFEKWLKTVTDSLADAKEALALFRDVNSVVLLLAEKMCFFSVVTLWIIGHIDPWKLAAAYVSCSAVCIITVLVIISEVFAEKFKAINEALYNLPWYSMTPKEKKILQLLISSSLRPISLTTGGVHDFNIEWFSQSVVGGYKAGLTMESLITG